MRRVSKAMRQSKMRQDDEIQVHDTSKRKMKLATTYALAAWPSTGDLLLRRNFCVTLATQLSLLLGEGPFRCAYTVEEFELASSSWSCATGTVACWTETPMTTAEVPVSEGAIMDREFDLDRDIERASISPTDLVSVCRPVIVRIWVTCSSSSSWSSWVPSSCIDANESLLLFAVCIRD